MTNSDVETQEEAGELRELSLSPPPPPPPKSLSLACKRARHIWHVSEQTQHISIQTHTQRHSHTHTEGGRESQLPPETF